MNWLRLPSAMLMLICFIITGAVDLGNSMVSSSQQEVCCAPQGSICGHAKGIRPRLAHQAGICLHQQKDGAIIQEQTRQTPNEQNDGFVLTNHCNCGLNHQPAEGFPRSISYQYLIEFVGFETRQRTSRKIPNTLYLSTYQSLILPIESPPPEYLG